MTNVEDILTQGSAKPATIGGLIQHAMKPLRQDHRDRVVAGPEADGDCINNGKPRFRSQFDDLPLGHAIQILAHRTTEPK